MKNPVRILVQRSPLQARLYLFSPKTGILEVTIQKIAEPGGNDSKVYGGNG